MVWLRSFLYFLFSIITIVIFGVACLFTFPLPFEKRYAFIRQWSRINLWCLRVCCNLKYRVIGRENIPEGNGIIFCKHQSTWETLVLQSIFPPQIWVLKKELLRLPFFGWGLALLEPIALDRGAGRKALKQLCDQGKQRLDNGRWVVIFPEGTRMAPGEKGQYQIGGAMLASSSGYPVVPVAHNAGYFWPRRGFLKQPGTIEVRIGEPIDTGGLSVRKINELAEQRIESMVAEIG